MSSPSRPTRLTAEQLYELPDDGRRHELLRGTVVSEPLPSRLHGRTVTRFSELLSGFVRARRLGAVYTGDTGFVLARHPDTVRGPDVAFVSAERERETSGVAPFFPGAPDLAVEVRSPHDRTSEVLAKVSDYLAAGCRLAWVADPESEEVLVFRSPLSPCVVAGDDALEGEDVLPGFRILVRELFEA